MSESLEIGIKVRLFLIMSDSAVLTRGEYNSFTAIIKQDGP